MTDVVSGLKKLRTPALRGKVNKYERHLTWVWYFLGFLRSGLKDLQT
jgi:uncharacterized membrane protein